MKATHIHTRQHEKQTNYKQTKKSKNTHTYEECTKKNISPHWDFVQKKNISPPKKIEIVIFDAHVIIWAPSDVFWCWVSLLKNFTNFFSICARGCGFVRGRFFSFETPKLCQKKLIAQPCIGQPLIWKL